MADNDVSVNDSPTCKSHELYLKMTEERKRTKEAKCVHDSSYIHSEENRNSQQLQHHNDGSSLSETLNSDNDVEDTMDDSNVPIKHINSKSFIKTPNNSHNDILNHKDIRKSDEFSSNSINEAVITRKKKIDSSNNYEEDIAYLSKRRILERLC